VKTITNTSRYTYEHGDYDARPVNRSTKKYCELVLTETKPIYCDTILWPESYANGSGDAAASVQRHLYSKIFGFSIFTPQLRFGRSGAGGGCMHLLIH